MNIVQEIQTLRTQMDFVVQAIKGDQKLFDFNSVKTDLEHAMSIIDSSKTAIGNLKNTISTHEATIAAHLAKIAELANTVSVHESTIAAMADASNEFGAFANTIHAKFTEYETYLKQAANVVVADVASLVTPIQPAPVVTEVAPAPAPEPVVEPAVVITPNPVHSIAAPVAGDINAFNVDEAFKNIVGPGPAPATETVTIGPLQVNP